MKPSPSDSSTCVAMCAKPSAQRRGSTSASLVDPDRNVTRLAMGVGNAEPTLGPLNSYLTVYRVRGRVPRYAPGLHGSQPQIQAVGGEGG